MPERDLDDILDSLDNSSSTNDTSDVEIDIRTIQEQFEISEKQKEEED